MFKVHVVHQYHSLCFLVPVFGHWTDDCEYEEVGMHGNMQTHYIIVVMVESFPLCYFFFPVDLLILHCVGREQQRKETSCYLYCHRTYDRKLKYQIIYTLIQCSVGSQFIINTRKKWFFCLPFIYYIVELTRNSFYWYFAIAPFVKNQSCWQLPLWISIMKEIYSLVC